MRLPFGCSPDPIVPGPEKGEHMNEDVFQGKWKQWRGRVKQAWGKVTDDDLTQIDGSLDRLVGTLQARYGYSKAEAKKQIEAEFGAEA